MGPACSNHTGIWVGDRNRYRSQTDDHSAARPYSRGGSIGLELTALRREALEEHLVELFFFEMGGALEAHLGKFDCHKDD